ncbi:MAG TPA: helix-turn-helix domain-containing protein, partial [Paenibacillus sp.]|jgi:two-component system response regulator YesN
LIITDIKMPVMDGLELIREAAQFLDTCQYVILSCLDEFQYAKEALRLGAVDYLIKSDIKPQQLLEVLDTVRKKVAQAASYRSDRPAFQEEEYKESVSYLKETIFKELFSGFLYEEEVLRRGEALNLSLVQGPMMLVKLRVDRFEDIRQKYIEQDEKLLRYSVMNIMEEMIPRRWRKEIVALNSAEYVVVINVLEEGVKFFQAELDKLLSKILTTMKEFLNISFSIGISGQAPSFSGLKKAYGEADTALRRLFFTAERQVLYFKSECSYSRSGRDSYHLSRDEERTIRDMVENDGEGVKEYLEELKLRLLQEGISEQGIRKTYLRLLLIITSCFPSTPELWNEGRTPYEELLLEERLEDLHSLILRLLDKCLEYHQALDPRPQSYAEQACAIIRSQYAEDISLQTVAKQINVNPSYLSRIFKQETGENFVTYLTRFRIEKAQYYLRDRSFKVYEIADKVGYRNTAYFSKIFKKMMGLSPEEYRDRSLELDVASTKNQKK